MAIDFFARPPVDRHVAIAGDLPGFSKVELEILLRARGVEYLSAAPKKVSLALFSPEASGKKVDKANAYGVPVVLPEGAREALGDPLLDFRSRFERFLEEREDYYHNVVLAPGDPASAELLSRVEARVGFPLPAAARDLWSTMNGLSWLWTYGAEATSPTSSTPLDWSVCRDDFGVLWKTLRASNEESDNFSMGMCCIPDLETMFFSNWEGMIPTGKEYGEGDVIKLGKRAVSARAFFPNVFMFDVFHPYYQAALWADPEDQAFYIVYSSDHGASWGFAAPVPFELYMEQLLVDRAVYRFIKLNNTRSASTAMTKLSSKKHWVIAPYRGL